MKKHTRQRKDKKEKAKKLRVRYVMSERRKCRNCGRHFYPQRTFSGKTTELTCGRESCVASIVQRLLYGKPKKKKKIEKRSKKKQLKSLKKRFHKELKAWKSSRLLRKAYKKPILDKKKLIVIWKGRKSKITKRTPPSEPFDINKHSQTQRIWVFKKNKKKFVKLSAQATLKRIQQRLAEQAKISHEQQRARRKELRRARKKQRKLLNKQRRQTMHLLRCQKCKRKEWAVKTTKQLDKCSRCLSSINIIEEPLLPQRKTNTKKKVRRKKP